jgi:transketolase
MATRKGNRATRRLAEVSTKKKQFLEGTPLTSLANIATRLRMDSVRSTTVAGSGHPSSCSSLAELMAALFFDTYGMKYYPHQPENFNNDRLVLSKGHAAPILYAAWAEAGYLRREQLSTLRRIDSDLEGHPMPSLPFVDVATGSLGQGLSAACGLAYSMKYLEKNTSKVFCILGDGEVAEGSVWEAFNFASIYKLDNLVAIVDVNRLGQSQPTAHEHDVKNYKDKIQSFGWHCVNVDGHNLEEIVGALHTFRQGKAKKGKPFAIVAKTLKGKDFPGLEDQLNWHGKPIGEKSEEVEKFLQSKLHDGETKIAPQVPESALTRPDESAVTMPAPAYELGKQIATRVAYGEALRSLGLADERVVALDGDTKNSTFSQYLLDALDESQKARFVECFIAEQNMVGVAMGISKRGRIPFASTFAAFHTRAYDFIRMAAVSRANIKLVGSHCGVSIGEDGASQMGLEDLAMMRAIPNSVVFYPSDAVSCHKAVELAANYKGIAYIRTSRPATPVLYSNSEVFEVGKSKVVKHSPNDVLTVVGAGITLAESLKAYDTLKQEGISIRLVDLFSVKPIDRDLLLASASASHNKILTVEDHYPEGGIFEAVSGALSQDGVRVYNLSVGSIPRSGKPNELLDMFGISAEKIAEKVREVLRG